MEQDITEMNGVNDLPGDLPENKEAEAAARAAEQLAADLLREQAAGPVPLESTAPGQGEDAVLLVETISLPDQPGTLSPEGIALAEIDLDERSPWYRSRWLYMGAGLAGGAALAVGAVLLLRNRSARQRSTPLGRARHTLSHWSSQLSGQADKLTERATKLTDQAQDQISQLVRGRQRAKLTLIPLQRRSRASTLLKQAQHQMSDLFQPVGDQLNALGSSMSSLGSAIGASTTQALDKTQEGLAQMRQGVASGATRTRKGIRTGWKFSRNFTIGLAAGAVWAAIFTPQAGETTRQRLTTLFQSVRPWRQ